jgi:hypothetical protein
VVGDFETRPAAALLGVEIDIDVAGLVPQLGDLRVLDQHCL